MGEESLSPIKQYATCRQTFEFEMYFIPSEYLKQLQSTFLYQQ